MQPRIDSRDYTRPRNSIGILARSESDWDCCCFFRQKTRSRFIGTGAQPRVEFSTYSASHATHSYGVVSLPLPQIGTPNTHTSHPVSVFVRPSHSNRPLPRSLAFQLGGTRCLGGAFLLPIGDADDPAEKNVPLLSTLHQARMTHQSPLGTFRVWRVEKQSRLLE